MDFVPLEILNTPIELFIAHFNVFDKNRFASKGQVWYALLILLNYLLLFSEEANHICMYVRMHVLSMYEY